MHHYTCVKTERMNIGKCHGANTLHGRRQDFQKRGRVQLHRAPSGGECRKSRGQEFVVHVVCAQSTQPELIVHRIPPIILFEYSQYLSPLISLQYPIITLF